ncbi:protein kinase [Pyxidicoccus fallax]|uniref:Protein kinase n=1 Tax=Pyxidicoccus fallax TaxID=394095 RepID=A0A848LS71_9BACT|nr:protein kinase [Pyxidicoccus fallax]NPC81449.1 protein kinase [Pyxidicoccus fallax]
MSQQGSTQIVATDKQGRSYRYQTDGEPIGVGSGGQVFLARRLPDTADAAADEVRRVAIKVTQSPKWKTYLAEEARLLHRLQEQEDQLVSHMGGGTYRLVRIHSGPEPLTADDPYRSSLIELEYLDGITLRQWFDSVWVQGPQPSAEQILSEVRLIAQQLAEALAQLERGQTRLVHRDIKPDNVMRTSRGLRLFDFNVAREDSASTKTQHVGTPGYIAPEVIEGGVYDTRADLYSVGVLLWEVVHRRKFDPYTDTVKVEGRAQLRWPTAVTAEWPDSFAAALRQLLTGLVTDVSLRLPSAAALLKAVRSLEDQHSVAPSGNDPLAPLDMISLLSELRPSGLAAVVTDTSGKVAEQALQNYLRTRMHVDDALEDWLLDELRQAASPPKRRPTLFVLAGNAGDGKSHLLFRILRMRLSKEPELLKRIRAIADATHALAPDASQADRLSTFFAPFADETQAHDDRVHLIAMNTGMVIRFFEQTGARFLGLYRELQRQLGLRRAAAGEPKPAWRVEVINLDLRDLLASTDGVKLSFAERMLDRLDPEHPEGIPSPKWGECQACPAFQLCPVAFNLRALKLPVARKALVRTLQRIGLDTDVHLSPRNLWGFMYRLVTGGTERYDLPTRALGEGPCDVVRTQAAKGNGEWLLSGQFTETLFRQQAAGAVWQALSRHDPAFSSAPAIDHLHTRLSIKTELDNNPETIRKLGGDGQTLAGLSLDALTAMLPRDGSFKGGRRDAAVRRQVMFDEEAFQAWFAQEGAEDFSKLLRSYNDFSHIARTPSQLPEDARTRLRELRELVQQVFLLGNGRTVDGAAYLQVSQPNVRARNELLVRADSAALDDIFNIQKIVAPDVHIEAHVGRPALLTALGYRPNQVTLTLLGVRLTVDLSLYGFLRRVSAGQKPSMRDLTQHQALLYIGERVGNELAQARRAKDLYVWDADAHSLSRLHIDDFGQPHLKSTR